MKLKITLFFILTILFVSCKKETENSAIENTDLIKDAETNTIIRPIPHEVLEKLEDSIQLYYTKLSNFEIWYDSENRTDLINEIKFCYKEGLEPNDYNLDKIESLESKRNTLDDEEMIHYDILLTETYRKLANHLYTREN